MQDILIWWLISAEVEFIEVDPQLEDWQDVVRSEICGMCGRPLRGRLWVCSSVYDRYPTEDIAVPDEICDKISLYSGGIVMLKSDWAGVPEIAKQKGYLTTIDMVDVAKE